MHTQIVPTNLSKDHTILYFCTEIRCLFGIIDNNNAATCFLSIYSLLLFFF